jgi:hypothetical protein
MSERENTIPGIKSPLMAELENVPQRHVLFKIFCIYTHRFLFHCICLKDFYTYKRLYEDKL